MDQDFVIDAVLGSSPNRVLLERLPALGLGDAWLVSGAVCQPAWNALTGRPPDYGIRDRDVFYFDADTSWAAEDAVIRRVLAATADLGVAIEVRNQARVHLWYQQKFGTPYAPLRSATAGIERFLATAVQVGIRHDRGRFVLHAPHGIDDILTMTVRPNPTANFSIDLYQAKAAAWKTRWPELRVLPASGET